ncbi:uncharacterized protein [Malus domestica]|uniref:uncharacterized protein n=1 Tax=Malus domestica TaxID=3750 RepID=UPI0039765439
MGKSTSDLPNQNAGHHVPQAQNPISAVTPESTSATRREREVNLGGQVRSLEIPDRNTCVLNEGVIEDCDENGGEGSDPPTRSFIRKRLDEQSRTVEQTLSRGIDKLHDVIRISSEAQTRLLEILVSKVSDGRIFDLAQHLPPRNNLLSSAPAEPIPARLRPLQLEKGGGSNSRSDGSDQRAEVMPVDMTEVQRMIDSAMKKGLKFPKFIHPYPAYVEQVEYPRGFKIPDFSLFTGESSLSSLEHVARFTAQCGYVNSDFHKLRLFNFSLIGSAFAWYINLPPNSVQSWEKLVEKFHEQFYRPGMEMSVSSLARMAQASDESPMDYLTRFKSARNWCRVPLPEVEFVRLALNGLDVEYKMKFLGVNFRDMYELAQHVEQYDDLLHEEKISKTPSRGTIYKNPTVSYASTEDECVSVDAAEIVIDKPYVCKALTQVDSKEVKTRSATEGALKPSKVYTFDITKADAIFYQLLSARIIKLRPGHNIPKAEELKGKIYYYTTDEDSGTAVLCSKCRAKVGSESEEKPSSLITERPTAATQQKVADVGQHQGVFDRLGPKVRMEEAPSVRRRLDFNASFYDDDYYKRNSSSSESSRSQKTFKPPKPSDQRWYTYHSSKGVYTALSKSQKRRHQRIDCMARRQAAQETSAPQWRLKDTIVTDDERPPPAIMTELVQGKRLVNRDIETTFEEADKRIKLLLRPGEMKARLEHFRQEAESKLPPPAIQEPLIKIRRNLHPPFLGEALEYMREFHKKHSANDLDARIHYQEQARILTPNTLSTSTSLEVITQNQQAAEATTQDQTLEEGAEESLCPTLTTTEAVVANQTRDKVNEEDPNLMGPSVLDNMEINMVHVLLAAFQSSTAQLNFLDGDVVAEEAGHVDFVSVAEVDSTTKDDNIKAALAELFPRSPSANLHHLKPLYVTAHIEGYPISKVFVDCGATVNIMPMNIMKALRCSNDELISSGITMSSFVGDKSQTKGVLPLTVNIAGRIHMTAFFVVDSKTEYNALLGRDWIHQTSCFNDEGRPTQISVQKAIEVGAETVHQDSARLGLANFLPEADV